MTGPEQKSEKKPPGNNPPVATATSSFDPSELGDQMAALAVKDATELVDYLKHEYGIEAPDSPPQQQLPQEKLEEEKTEFDVIIEDFGEKKIEVIKVVRRIIQGLGLKEAKSLVENLPATVKEAVSKEEAEQVKLELEKAGAKVVIK